MFILSTREVQERTTTCSPWIKVTSIIRVLSQEINEDIIYLPLFPGQTYSCVDEASDRAAAAQSFNLQHQVWRSQICIFLLLHVCFDYIQCDDNEIIHASMGVLMSNVE